MRHPPTKPINNSAEVDEATRHRDVGQVHCQDLVGPGDRQLVQKIGIDFVPRRWLGGIRTPIDRLDAHLLHQRRDMQSPNLQPFSSQEPLQHPASGKGVVEMQFVDPAHQGKIAVRHWTRQIIDAATAEAEKLRLARDGEFVLAVDHFFLPSNPALPSAPDKKSFSSVSSPIIHLGRMRLRFLVRPHPVTRPIFPLTS